MLTIIATASLVAGSHVRSADSVMGAVLRDGLLGSAVIQRLVDVIDDSNVIVYLARGNFPRTATACVMVAGRTGRSIHSDQFPAAARTR